MTAVARVVNLKVVSDSICPWCLIGTMELRKALARVKANALPVQVNIEYRPYQLDPTLSEDTALDRKERYLRKFGSRVLLKAYKKGGQDAQQAILTEILMGYHELEEDIGDPKVLAGYAEKTGVMTRAETLEFLASDELRKEVAAGIGEAREMGVTGVPFTVINDKWAISGGQPSEVFYQVFEKLSKEQNL
ncbi:hypothetical protein FRC10_005379 [Ceratobasidium sp. 414]|nr:hypothetical protein FRC10_005379 [Ceratobasidium sp. 414]